MKQDIGCCRLRCASYPLRLYVMLILLGLSTFSVNAHIYAQQQKFNLNIKSITIKDVFQKIESESEFIFIYSENNVNIKRKVNVHIKNGTVEEVLNEVFKGTDNYFEINDRQIVVLSKKKEVDSSASETRQPGRSIKGIVTDKSGAPLPGVNVWLKGTNLGTVTNNAGMYVINPGSNADAVLKFSFIGMKSREITIGSQETINIELEFEEYSIADVTVKGAYGTVQKRSDMVGSAYQVESEQIKNLPANRVDLLLDGLVPGLKIEPNTDSPATTRTRYNTRIRGTASLSASSEPLWIVDGTPIYTGNRTNMIPGMSASVSPLASLNPDDIESITVLKDASATSIYGANGANGVVLITTKKGIAGKPALKIQTRYGVSKIDQSTKVKVLNGPEYLELARESYKNAGLDMSYFPYQDNDMNQYSNVSTDWSDIFYGIGQNILTNISLNGGTDKAQYYVSGSYYNEKQTIIGNTTDRFSFRANNTVQVTDKLKASLNLFASYSRDEMFNMGTDYYDFLPIFSPYNPDGSYRLYNKYIDGKTASGEPNWVTKKFFNSVAEREENEHKQSSALTNVNLSLSYNIIDGLDVTSQVGLDYNSRYENQYSARSNWSGMNTEGVPVGYATRGHFNSLVVTNINRLNFQRSFGKHDLNALLGIEINSNRYHTVSASGTGFVNDHIREVSYAVDQRGSSSANLDHALSFFSQVGYAFDKRYYLTLNARRDGNSTFGKDVRWGDFYSLGASWNIHNESFFSSNCINILKFKASYGTNGNSRLGAQEAQGVYSYSNSYNYNNEPGTYMTRTPNPGLSWETTWMANIGLRIGLFNWLDIDAEWYDNKTVDLLNEIDVSRTTGSTRITRNVGSIRNRGFEGTVSINWLKRQNTSWTTSINMAHNQNTLLELYEGVEKTMGTKIWREGEGIDTYYLVRWAGVDPRDGAPIWYDLNGNLTRIYNTDNRVADKSSTPDLTGGAMNSFRYKNLEISMLFNYEIGGYAFSSFARNVNSDGLNIMSDNQSVNQLDRWQKQGDTQLNPKPIWGVSTRSVMNSTRYLYEKTNIRLQNIAVTYNLPTEFTKRLGIQNSSIGIIGDNLAMWTRYDKQDRNSYRQSMRPFPLERVYSLNLNITF